MSNMSRPVGIHYQGDLRRALLEVAAEAIATSGPEGVSLRQLARTLGVSHAAPAHHFGDKTGLLTAVAVEGFERFSAHLAAALIAMGPAEPVEILLTLAKAYSEFADDEPGYFDIMFLPALIRVDDPAYIAAGDEAFAALRSVIDGCQMLGWRPQHDPLTLSAAAWSMAHGVAVLRRHGSLVRHYPNGDLNGVAAIVASLIGHD